MTQPPLAATSKRTAALIAIVAVMAVWGSTFVVTKAAVQQFPPFTLAFLRFAIACAALAPFLRRGSLAGLGTSVSVGRLLFLSVTGVALFTAAFNFSMIYGSAVQGALLYAAIPAVVAVCAVLFLNERLSGRRTLGIALSVLGAALIVATGESRGSDAPAPLVGAALMIFTIVLWGAYTVAAKPVASADQTAVTFVTAAVATLLLLPASALELAVAGWPSTTTNGWLGVLYLGVFASAAAYALYSFALRELDASTVGAFSSVDPIVGLATAYVFLGETLSPVQAVGAAIVLAGMWLASLR
jgi:drug/metabolite transporter (DMT)-like permease